MTKAWILVSPVDEPYMGGTYANLEAYVFPDKESAEKYPRSGAIFPMNVEDWPHSYCQLEFGIDLSSTATYRTWFDNYGEWANKIAPLIGHHGLLAPPPIKHRKKEKKK